MYIYVEILTSDQRLISKQRLCLVKGRYNKKKKKAFLSVGFTDELTYSNNKKIVMM